MYADDTIILSDSAEGLQDGLNTLAEYCDQWKLTVNTIKTKVMDFSKSRRKTHELSYSYKGNQIEQVKSYRYLGVTLRGNGSMNEAIKENRDKGLPAMFSLIQKCRKLWLTPDIALELFDRTVQPISGPDPGFCRGGGRARDTNHNKADKPLQLCILTSIWRN
jgi:hypothetical protein